MVTNMLVNAVAISKWGTSLSANTIYWFYGCDLAANQAGIDLVNQLAN